MGEKRIIVAQAPPADGAPGRLAVGVTRWTDPVPTLTILVKMTCSFGDDARLESEGEGERAHLVQAVEPEPLSLNVLEKRPSGDDELRYPSDFVPLKDGADVLLVGHGYGAEHHLAGGSPLGEDDAPTVRIAASIRIGALTRSFQLVRAGEGGAIALDARYVRDATGVSAPHVGPIATKEILSPPAYHAPGFDYSVYNAAAPAQRLPEIEPGMEVQLVGLSPRAEQRTLVLPELFPRAFIDHRDRSELSECYLFCDTLLLDTDRERAVLVFRGIFELTSLSAAEINRLVITLDRPSKLRSTGEILRELPRGEFFYARTAADLEPNAPPVPEATVELKMARFATWGYVEPPEPRLTLERYATVSAALIEQREPRAEVFRAHEVEGETWLLEERAWSAKISTDRALAVRYGELFVEAQDALAEPREAERGTIDYLRLVAAMDRKPQAQVLEEAKISQPAWQRLKRRCSAELRRQASEKAKASHVKELPRLPAIKALAPAPRKKLES